ncbi:MAG: hypothetical protein HRU22_09520, partial [Gammaproteobacteria bacterium]|nr:hypothetical protein [Gammaproteobacteria bacterium]
MKGFKKTILSTAVIMGLGFTIQVQAGEDAKTSTQDSITIEQAVNAVGSVAIVQQTSTVGGLGNIAIINQTGLFNGARITQDGDLNEALISQD